MCRAAVSPAEPELPATAAGLTPDQIAKLREIAASYCPENGGGILTVFGPGPSDVRQWEFTPAPSRLSRLQSPGA